MNNNIQQYFESNRSLWNKRAEVHFNSEFYNVKSLKAGKGSLNKIELIEMGDVKEKTLLHLQTSGAR